MLTANKALEQVEQGAELNTPEVRVIKECAIGKGYRQGDIYVYRVDDKHPRGKKLGSHKLAIGEGEGSNHFAEGAIECFEGKRAPDFINRRMFLGPLIVAPKGFKNTHPRHAHCHMEQGGTFQVVHQLDARSMRRVQD
jgi:hypothetical protein